MANQNPNQQDGVLAYQDFMGSNFSRRSMKLGDDLPR